MDDVKQKMEVQQFIKKWTGKGQENKDDRSYWIDILERVLGVENTTDHIEFQKEVIIDGKTKRIDAYIPETKVLIEQKSLGHNLDKKGLQSDGELLTPFEQADRYNKKLKYDEYARWIVTSNFSEIWIYDMNQPESQPVKLLLSELEDNYNKLDFLVNQETKEISHEIKISKDAGELVGKLYDAFLKQYPDPESKETLHSLNVLCVRLVFCLYAENSGLFGHNGMFREYMESFETDRMRWALEELFKVLDTPDDKRPRHLADDNPKAVSFPYVNGGLFSERDIDIQPFTEEIRELLLDKASAGFNWSDISPTIFGAVFESTLNPETRRAGGMHYTSIENIHKVIDPLFLDDLKAEFKEICDIAVERTRNKKLQDFQNKLASLNFLDPACGSGNFLTEAYLSLRHLENEAIRVRLHDQMTFGEEGINPIQVSLGQFYGIEINDFAVSVAKTALWIAESQMIKETKAIVVSADIPFLPLKSYANIIEGNALRIDWEDIVPKNRLSYIMGNPPFVGVKLQSQTQKEDIKSLPISNIPKLGLLDYVCGWYIKTSLILSNSNIKCAFVSTNSITQGEQPGILWDFLFSKNIEIDFAYRTFVWMSKSKGQASVHCVIIGFSNKKLGKTKKLFDEDHVNIVNNINPYLIAGENITISPRKTPWAKVPPMIAGNKTVKCLALILDEQEKTDLVNSEPQAEKYIKRMIGADEFINNIPRYCLWLVDCPPSELRTMPLVLKRVEQVREDRLNSKDKQAHELALRPTQFRDTNNPDSAIVVPLVSSQRRRYIPIGYIDNSVIANNKVSIIPNGTLYQFGILTSNVHNSWMRVVAMRMKSDYSYSLSIVYNTFPWPESTDKQKHNIEQTAQAILDARALYPDSSLADLYDPLAMPKELQMAHRQNDIAVMSAYGFTKGTDAYTNEDACVAELMKMYQKLTSENQTPTNHI